ncbi:hypothetical protein ACVBEH_21205 [Roseateles sp. GG27B]
MNNMQNVIRPLAAAGLARLLLAIPLLTLAVLLAGPRCRSTQRPTASGHP